MPTTIIRNCPRCGSNQQTFDIHSIYLAQNDICEAPAVCRACEQGVIFLTSRYDLDKLRGSGSYTSVVGLNTDITSNLRNKGFVSIAHHNVQEPPEHLPGHIERVFREGAACYAIGCWNAAGAMYRTCIDLSTKSLLPAENDVSINKHQRNNLAARLAWLFEHKIISDELVPLAEVIREDANDGVHDGTLGRVELDDLQDFAIEFLRRVHTNPERIRIAKERREARHKEAEENEQK